MIFLHSRELSPWKRRTPNAVALVLCALFASPSFASDGQIPSGAQAIADARVAGTATVRWFGIRAFDAKLVTPNGANYDPTQQAALELQYAVRFTSEELFEATMEELDRLEGARSDHPQIAKKLSNCFAAVGPQDRFLAVGSAKNRIKLFRNGQQTCDLSHSNIRARFLAIWLSPESRFPSLSRKLRGS